VELPGAGEATWSKSSCLEQVELPGAVEALERFLKEKFFLKFFSSKLPSKLQKSL
jgi:hypothetical protein